MYDAGNATTPTLFITSENGINSPSTSSMYAALKQQGVDTQHLVYKGEGHVVSQPANQRDLVYWCVNWVDTHLGYSPTPDPKGVFDIAAMMPASGRITKR
jgi:dipeptidyl aminopeptidase/acylaminoacyl peptidase